jgi:UDP:flavonoid glycosyltransferase YjiC (YdhE family)
MRPRRYLFTTWEGGGHVPPALILASRLAARGHEVRLVSDAANRPAAMARRLAFDEWRRAPNRQHLGDAGEGLRDWAARTPWGAVRAICDGVIAGPAEAYARDVLEIVETWRPDVIVSQELMFGVMAAAEKAAIPLALLTANLWCFPTRPDVPPFGPGFPPATSRFTEGREAVTRRLIAGWYDAGRPALNAARAALGLAPLPHLLDQLAVAGLILLGTARAFDFGAAPPPPFHYAGPLFEVPDWARGAAAPEGIAEGPPLVLVSFSTTAQGQAPVVARCIRALAGLPVRGLVTAGPALAGLDLPAAPNVRVVASLSHDAVMPHCAAVICHGGHGTLIRPLMAGVPVVCLPMGRDHPENAVRVVSRGAGLALSRHAGRRRIRAAVAKILTDPAFRRGAAALGHAVARETDGGASAAARLEGFAEAG